MAKLLEILFYVIGGSIGFWGFVQFFIWLTGRVEMKFRKRKYRDDEIEHCKKDLKRYLHRSYWLLGLCLVICLIVFFVFSIEVVLASESETY